MTRARYEPGAFRLRIEGHAGAGPLGADPVCAAASILAWTLCERASEEKDFAAQLYRNEREAVIELRCYPEEEAEERCRCMLDTVATGFELLAERYGAYVQLELVE